MAATSSPTGGGNNSARTNSAARRRARIMAWIAGTVARIAARIVRTIARIRAIHGYLLLDAALLLLLAMLALTLLFRAGHMDLDRSFVIAAISLRTATVRIRETRRLWISCWETRTARSGIVEPTKVIRTVQREHPRKERTKRHALAILSPKQ